MVESVKGIAASAVIRDGDLVRIWKSAGPFLTVWVPTIGAVERPADELAVWWRSMSAHAAEVGAGDQLLDALAPLYADAYRYGDGMVVVGAGDRVVLAESLPDPPPRDLVRWASLPSIAPVIKQRQSDKAHVVVLADRTGADIVSVSRRGGVDIVEVDETGGRPVSKTRGDGWSHRRNQQRTENTWAHNARAVAAEVEAAVEKIDATAVIATGDERSLGLLEQEMSSPLHGMLRLVPGGRSADGSEDALEAHVDTVVRTEAARETAELLQRYDEEREKHGGLASDVDGVLGALSAAQVDVLLVHDDPDDGATAWFDPEGFTVARDRSELAGLVDEPVEGRLVDAAIRSALLGGAAVHVVPATALPSRSVGALLRWT